MNITSIATQFNILLFCTFNAYAISSNQGSFDKDKKYYVVDEQGRVDKKTYNGWRRFGSCSGCHGSSATGGTSGPNLLLAIKNKKIDFATFKKIVSEGRPSKGMPAWEVDPNVNKHYADIYGYLRARSDGMVKKGGRPKKIPK